MGANIPGSKEYRQNERAAQERYNIPKDKAGRDYISRVKDHETYSKNGFDIFGQICIKCRKNQVETCDDYFCKDCVEAEQKENNQ